MNFKLTGLHLEVTQPLRDYVESKLDRVTRHVDNVIDVAVTLSVDKLDRQVLRHKEKLDQRRAPIPQPQIEEDTL